MTSPLFGGEGPQYYAAAYAHNAPFARGGPYQTALNPQQEAAFRQWVKANKVRFDPNEDPTDYDMRGFWLSGQQPGREPSGGVGYPDTFKTPYDTTFSRESKYATSNCPFAWHGNHLIDERNNQLIFDRTIAESGWHGEIRHADGAMTHFPIGMSDGGPTPTTTVRLNPGERLRVYGPDGGVVQETFR